MKQPNVDMKTDSIMMRMSCLTNSLTQLSTLHAASMQPRLLPLLSSSRTWQPTHSASSQLAAFIRWRLKKSHHIMMIFTQNHKSIILHSDSPSRNTALSAVALLFAEAGQGTGCDLHKGWASCHSWPLLDGDQDQVGARHPHHEVEAGHKPRGGVEEWWGRCWGKKERIEFRKNGYLDGRFFKYSPSMAFWWSRSGGIYSTFSWPPAEKTTRQSSLGRSSPSFSPPRGQ